MKKKEKKEEEGSLKRRKNKKKFNKNIRKTDITFFLIIQTTFEM